MRRIALATASRSERGLLDPVIARLRSIEAHHPDLTRFQLVEPRLSTQWEGYFYDWMTNGTKPDVILIPADRKEMVSLAMRCYYAEIPIFHMWAGIGGTDTYDDLNRRVISSFSYLMMCEDEQAKERLIASGEEPWRVHVTGTTHFDDLEVDESLCPKETYTLFLINPNQIDPQDTNQTLSKAVKLATDSALFGGDQKLVWIGSGDPLVNTLPLEGVTFYNDLPRMQFLGLLKNCAAFVSNSSAGVYEAGFFGRQVINPGKRNSKRNYAGDFKPGASDRIVDLLCTYPLEKQHLLKIYD